MCECTRSDADMSSVIITEQTLYELPYPIPYCKQHAALPLLTTFPVSHVNVYCVSQ